MTTGLLIQPYQEIWTINFEKIKNELLLEINDLVKDIHHIGSTSIPNLPAKPIIDIDIELSTSAHFDQIKRKLAKLGYYHNGDQGISGREVFKRAPGAKLHGVLDTISHHLYVCPSHSEELKRHLLFRNYLKNNTKELQEYASLKIGLAHQAGQDRKLYALLKENFASDFINQVILQASNQNEEKTAQTNL